MPIKSSSLLIKSVVAKCCNKMTFIGLAKSGILAPKLHNHNLLLESRSFNSFFAGPVLTVSLSVPTSCLSCHSPCPVFELAASDQNQKLPSCKELLCFKTYSQCAWILSK